MTSDHLDPALPRGEEKRRQVRAMFDAIAPRYDVVNRLMTLGLDQRWRRRTVHTLAIARGSLVVDLACGTGDLSRIAVSEGYQVVGVDSSVGMLKANRHGVPCVLADAESTGIASASMDGIVSGYAFRNFTDLDAVLTEAARILRPGGRIAVLEVAAPTSGVLRFGFDLWFGRMVPLLGRLLSDAAAYRYLPKSTAYLPDTPALRSLFLQAGFSTVGQRPLWGGLSQLITATRLGLPRTDTRMLPSSHGSAR